MGEIRNEVRIGANRLTGVADEQKSQRENEKKRERERERDTHTDREKDRQTDLETEIKFICLFVWFLYVLVNN